MNTELNAYVPNVIFEKIPIKNLVSSQDYQRSLSESQILKIAREFDLHQINPVKVSRRDGYNYVFDGDDQLAEINEGITEVVEDNLELKARVKSLREERNQA